MIGWPVRVRKETRVPPVFGKETPMITLSEAWAVVLQSITPMASENLPLEQAVHAFLAEPIRADRDIPPADRSAMDGYALRAADLSRVPATLTVCAEVAAGSDTAPALLPGACVRIFTGANVPPDADAVIPVEQTSTQSFHAGHEDAVIEIKEAVSSGAHIFKRGENAGAGDVLLEAGIQLRPRQIAVCAASGYASVSVIRRPRIQILTTGAELLDASGKASAHQTRNSNGPLLSTALAEAGFPDVSTCIVPDDPTETLNLLEHALEQAEAVIFTGGVSAGKHDYVPAALEAAGATIHYHGLRMKPGKPQIFATTTKGQAIFGLPGNPLSSIVGFYELVLPALRRLSGCPEEDCKPSFNFPLAATAKGRGDRLHIIPAQLEHSPSGTVVRPRPPVGSADLVTAGLVDGGLLVPAGVSALDAGETVEFRPWGRMP